MVARGGRQELGTKRWTFDTWSAGGARDLKRGSLFDRPPDGGRRGTGRAMGPEPCGGAEVHEGSTHGTGNGDEGTAREDDEGQVERPKTTVEAMNP